VSCKIRANFTPRKQIKSTTPSFENDNPLSLDIWYEILILLDIVDEISLSKAFPRFFGAFILSKQVIRFQNAINSYMRSDEVDLPVGPPASFIRFLSRNSSLEYTSLVSWLRPVLSSSIVLNRKLFEDLSSIIASKDRGFVSVSSSLSSWAAEMKGECETECSIFWILLFRASISGYLAADFHRACDGMGKCVVVVKADNGRIAAAYNEDGFTPSIILPPPISMASSLLLTEMASAGRYFIEMIKQWES
jgi:hypothetical protein